MIEWIVERLIGLLGPVAKLQKDKRDLADSALRSVSEALTETCLYYRAIEASSSVRPTFVCRHCGAPMIVIETFACAQHIRGPPASPSQL